MEDSYIDSRRNVCTCVPIIIFPFHICVNVIEMVDKHPHEYHNNNVEITVQVYNTSN